MGLFICIFFSRSILYSWPSTSGVTHAEIQQYFPSTDGSPGRQRAIFIGGLMLQELGHLQRDQRMEPTPSKYQGTIANKFLGSLTLPPQHCPEVNCNFTKDPSITLAETKQSRNFTERSVNTLHIEIQSHCLIKDNQLLRNFLSKNVSHTMYRLFNDMHVCTKNFFKI